MSAPSLPADVIKRTADDDHPATLDLDQPCPDDIGAAVLALWEIARGLRDELAELRRSQM